MRLSISIHISLFLVGGTLLLNNAPFTIAKKSNLPASLQHLFGPNHSQPLSSKEMRPETGKMVSKSREHKQLAEDNEITPDELLEHDTTTGLQCYTCNSEDDCKIWEHLNAGRLKTCSAGESCMLHFSTKRNVYTSTKRMPIVGAGCEVPKSKDLDPAGCFITRNGAKTCYCKENKCNDNAFECKFCEDPELHSIPTWKPRCFHPRNYEEEKDIYKPKNTYAKECTIVGVKGVGFIADLEYFTVEYDGINPPDKAPWPYCTNDVKRDWEDVHGDIFWYKCSCSTNYCNDIVREVTLSLHFDKPEPPCNVCYLIREACHRMDGETKMTRRLVKGQQDDICYTKYVKDSKSGKFLMIDYADKVPRLGENGEPVTRCVVEFGRFELMTRTCYCDGRRDPGCTKFKCYSCGNKDCTLVEEDCDKEDGVPQECFINYEDSVNDPVVRAGCRALSMADNEEDSLDPLCVEEDASKWMGSGKKKSCHCETSSCNGEILKKLLHIEDESNPYDPNHQPIPRPGPKKNTACILGGVELWMIFGILVAMWH